MRYRLSGVALLVLLAPVQGHSVEAVTGHWVPDEKTYLFIDQFEDYAASLKRGSDQVVVGLDTISKYANSDINSAKCKLARNSLGQMQYGTSGESPGLNNTLRMAFYSNRRIKLYVADQGCTIGDKQRIMAVKVEP